MGQRNYTQAGDFFKLDGDLKSAVRAYLKGDNFNEAARIYETMGKLKKAEKLLRKNGTAKDMAEFQLRNNNTAAAIDIYLNCGMDFEAAELLESHGQIHRAAELYERLRFFEKAGILYGKSRRFDKAIVMFEKVVESLEKSMDGNVKSRIVKYQDWIANFHIGAKRFDEAGKIFESIHKLEKAAKCYIKAGRYLETGKILLKLNKTAEADKVLAKADSKEAQALRGEIALLGNRFQAAIEMLKETDQYDLLAKAHEALENYDRAAACLEKQGDLRRAAEMYSKAGEFAKAAILYEQNGHYDEAALNYEKQKKFEHAAHLYQKARNHYKAGFCFYQMKMLDQALGELQSLDEEHPNYADAKMVMSQIFFQQGDFLVARKLLEELTQQMVLDTSTLPYFYQLAYCLEKEGDGEGAKRYYERIATKNARYKDVLERLRRLQSTAPKPVAGTHSFSNSANFSPKTLAPGDIIDERFRILGGLGKGGMGYIFRVRDLQLDRDIALKMLIHDRGDFEELKVELLTARDLTHPYIIKVFDVGMWRQLGYFTMEFVKGTALKEYIMGDSRRPLHQEIELLAKICQGMHAAHDQGVVHRDIKPQNILIDSHYNPKILDFGIARKMDAQHQKRGISGSPKYMAPEQIRNASIDPRTDIYALGIIMFYMFTRKEPFLGKTPQEVMMMHLERPLPNPMDFDPELPYWLCEIIGKCCEKNPDMRFSNMNELMAELQLNLLSFDNEERADLLS